MLSLFMFESTFQFIQHLKYSTLCTTVILYKCFALIKCHKMVHDNQKSC